MHLINQFNEKLQVYVHLCRRRMMHIFTALVIFSGLRYGTCKMEGFIYAGVPATTADFPHVAFLFIYVKDGPIGCGASIVNQRILVTAAHCMDSCDKCTIIASAGSSSNLMTKFKAKVKDFYVHDDWNPKESINDIALLFLDVSLTYSSKIKRVAIMREVPSDKTVKVAGWGLIKGKQGEETETTVLQTTVIKLIPEATCKKFLNDTLPHTLCAEGVKTSYVTRGDSGSGLVMREYILVGLVSFGVPNRSKSIAVYTKVADFYDWITYYTKVLYCNNMDKSPTVKKGRK